MKLLPKAKGLGEVISAQLVELQSKLLAAVLRLSSLPLGSALKALLNLLIKASRAALITEAS